MSLKRSHVVIAAVAIWLAAFALSFVAPALTAPTGDGFTRGLNRIGVFLGWQMAATVVALVPLIVGYGQYRAQPGLRWLSRAPALVQLVLVVSAVVLVLYLRWAPPAQLEVPDRPVTAPAAEPIRAPEPF